MLHDSSSILPPIPEATLRTSYSMTERSEPNDGVEFLLLCISAYKKVFEGTLPGLAHFILSKTLLTPMP